MNRSCLITTLAAAALSVAVAASSQAAEQILQLGAVPKKLLDKGAGEGPAWHPELGILFSGHGNTERMAHDGSVHVFRKGAGTNGLIFDRRGRLVSCEAAARRITLWTRDGKVRVLTDAFKGMKYNQPNDLTIDSKGRIYFSDPRYGDRSSMELKDDDGRLVEGVFRIDPDGSVSRVITHEVDRPNGLVVTPDDRFLYVADNNNNEVGGARILWRFGLRKDGSVDHSSRRKVFDWKTGRGPDGMVLDRKGRLFVAGGRNKANLPAETADEFKGGVYIFSPEGKLLQFIGIPHDEVTNCTFGGRDMKTLYITAGGTLWSVRTVTAGRVVWPEAN